MEIYTIGFAKKSAEEFFQLLRRAGIEHLIDVRLRNSSQLSGFSKQRDLQFLLSELLGATYEHNANLAPTEDLLNRYKKNQIPWADYESEFLSLMADRSVERQMSPASFTRKTVLLCTEPTAERCHRRLVTDYLSTKWGDIQAVHL